MSLYTFIFITQYARSSQYTVKHIKNIL